MSVAPGDLFFGNVVSSYVDAPGFMRRDWLARELDDRLTRGDARFVLITGEPGAGKSGFVAQLASEHHDWPVFFIRRDQRVSLGETTARSLLLRIGFQMAAIHPSLFDLDQVRIDVTQRIGAADQQADVVGAEVRRIVASPFHRTVIRIRQEIDQAGGSITGLRVGEWIADPRAIDVDDLQEMALFRPARALARLKPDARIVILIDALDELRYHEDEGSLLDWLTNCPPLPDNVRIVATSRPIRGPLVTFKEKRNDSLTVLPIDSGDPRVQHDVRAYTETLLQEADVLDVLREHDRDPQEFLAALVERADGNLGYVGAMARAFHQALASPERRAVVAPLLRFEQLPDDLQGLFAFFLHQIQSIAARQPVRVNDPDTGKAVLVDAWMEVFRPILATLAVAFEPLTIEHLHALAGTLAERPHIVHALAWLEQFFDRDGPRYHFYHTSLLEFLTARTTRDDPGAADLYVDPVAEHRRVARLIGDEVQRGVIWQASTASTDARVQRLREYGGRHYVRHLFHGEEWAGVARAMDDARYGTGKLALDPTGFLYSQDLELAIKAVTRDELDDDARLAELARLWCYCTQRTSVTADADVMSDDALATLCLVGRLDSAERVVQLLSSPERQAECFVAMAEALASDVSHAERVRDFYKQACALAHDLPDTSREAIIDRIVASCEHAHGVGFRDAITADVVFKLAHGRTRSGDALATAMWYFQESGGTPTFFLHDPSAIDFFLLEPGRKQAGAASVASRANILASVAMTEHRLGRTQAAMATLDSALPQQSSADPNESNEPNDPKDPNDPNELVEARIAIARAYTAIGERERALALLREAFDTARALDDALPDVPAQRLPGSIIDIGVAFAEAGDWRQAVSIASHMTTGYSNPLRAAITELCRQSQWDEAIEIARTIVERERRARGRGGIFEVVGRKQRHSNAVEAYLTIVGSLAASGQSERALELIRALESSDDFSASPDARAEALARVAAQCARRGDRDNAERLLTQHDRLLLHSQVVERRRGVWRNLIALFTAAGAFDDATNAAGACGQEIERECRSDIAEAYAEQGRFDDALDAVERLESRRLSACGDVLRHVRDDDERFAAISERVLNIWSDELEHGRDEQYTYGGHYDRHEVRAEWLVRMASLLVRRREYPRAFASLSQACDALNAVRRFRGRPTLWAQVPAALAKAGDLQAALHLMKQINEPHDKAAGLIEFAGFAHADGRPDVANRMLADAFGTVAREWGASFLKARAVAKAAELGLDTLLNHFLENIPANDSESRGAAAIALSKRGELARARTLLADIPRVAVSEGAINPLSSPYAQLVIALLEAGDLDAAISLWPEVTDATDRVDGGIAFAAAHRRAGRHAEGIEWLKDSGKLAESVANQRIDRRLHNLAAELGAVAERGVAVRHVQQRWLAAVTWDELAGMLPWAHAAIASRPTLAAEIAAAFDWVDAVDETIGT